MQKRYKTLNMAFISSILICLSFVFAGCSGGSNGPIATDLSTGTGYNIKLSSSAGTLSVGGSSVITAVLYEPDGSPIRDNEDVLFASSEGGSFSDSTVKTQNGVANVVFTAGSTPMKYDSITASCHGAIGVIQVWILPATY